MICLDTNILIAHKRAKTADKDKTELYRLTVQGYPFAVSCITVYELLRGDNQDEDRYWKTMFARMKILAFDAGCAEKAAKIYKDIKQKGSLIEAEYLLIGATALQHGLPLATGNKRHFSRISGLQLVEPQDALRQGNDEWCRVDKRSASTSCLKPKGYHPSKRVLSLSARQKRIPGHWSISGN